MILEPETQNGSENDQKALGFSVKVEGVLRLCKIPKKALVLERFGASKKVDQNTLYNLSFMKTFRIKNAFWRSKVSKKH